MSQALSAPRATHALATRRGAWAALRWTRREKNQRDLQEVGAPLRVAAFFSGLAQRGAQAAQVSS
jgi:hypothetical protein